MIRNLKLLGLMAVAALAMSAMLASAAQATVGTGKFTSGATPGTHTASVLHGAQFGTEAENFFETSNGERTTCTNTGVTYTGNASGTASELTITPSYKLCTANGLPATVNMNGCTYKFKAPTKSGTHYDGTVDLVCPAGKTVVVSVFLFGNHEGVNHSVLVCTIKVFPKTGLTNTTYTADPGAKDNIIVDANINNISWTKEGSCGHSEGVAGKFVSKVTVSGKSAVEVPHDLWISGG